MTLKSAMGVATAIVLLLSACASDPEPAAGWDCGGAYRLTGELEIDVVGLWRSTFANTNVGYDIRADGTAEINDKAGAVHTVSAYNWRLVDGELLLTGADQESRLELEYAAQSIVLVGDPTWERCVLGG